MTKGFFAFFLGIGLLFLINPVSAQVTFKYDTTLLKKIAYETCKCFDNVNIETLNSDASQEIKSRADSCMMRTAFKHRKELNLFSNKSDDEYDDKMEAKLGMTVAIRLSPFLLRDCPAFLASVITNQLKKTDDEYETWEDEAVDSTMVYEIDPIEPEENYVSEYAFKGEIKAISPGYITFITVENDKKVTEKFVWLHKFYGEENLDADFVSNKGKQVTLEWKTTEIINPKTKKYETYKEIYWIELQ